MSKLFCILISAILFAQAWCYTENALVDISFHLSPSNLKDTVHYSINRTCSQDSNCHNLGSCIITPKETTGTCKCLEGTSGDLCQTVNECVADPYKCGEDTNVACVYDVVTRKAICVCKFEEFQRFDPTVKKCKECDCGSRGKDCQFVQGQKVCTCEPGYVQAPTMDYSDGRCRMECNQYMPCRNGGECVQGACICRPGTEGFYCEDIQFCTYRGGCNDGAKCVYDKASGPICKCPNSMDLYDADTRRCRECFCGEYSDSCGFDFMKSYKKTCNCRAGYAQLKGICSPCSCGMHASSCAFEEYPDRKVCTCEDGYVPLNGVCVECNCGNGAEKCEYVDGKKTCKCRDGFKNNGGTCSRCDCDIGSMDCIFDEQGIQNCTCKEGYQSSEGTCLDIDECLSTAECPTGTTCTNTPGNYTCPCKEGFTPLEGEGGSRDSGCRDIDECKEGKLGGDGRVCSSLYKSYLTRCINTPGSYYCTCLEGYTPYLDTEGLARDPEVDSCRELESNPWKTGSIVALVIIGLICFFGLVTVWKKRSSR